MANPDDACRSINLFLITIFVYLGCTLFPIGTESSFMSMLPASVMEEGDEETPSGHSPFAPSIFASTYNCGGCTADGLDLEVMLPYWIPPDHDLYIIGVSQTMNWPTHLVLIVV